MVLVYGEPITHWSCKFKECSAKCCKAGREVTINDIKKISEGLSLEPHEFLESLTDNGGLFHLKGKNERCFFLKEDFGCILHNKGLKPIFCKMYPFKFDGIIYADDLVLKVRTTKDCPTIGRGEKIAEDFETTIESLANRFLRDIEDHIRLKSKGSSFTDILESV